MLRPSALLIAALVALLSGLWVGTGAAGGNQPPVAPPTVVRTFAGQPLEVPIPATDPDGDDLLFASSQLPAGATLGATTGVFQWSTEGALGVYEIPVTVTDDGVPPESVETTLYVRVDYEDACHDPVCDPATGCSDDLVPITTGCCGFDEPTVYVDEPAASCPAGAVARLGRNRASFGRVRNCNFLELRTGTQFDLSIAINLQARCIDQPATMRLGLETAEHVLIDDAVERPVSFTTGPGGFLQSLQYIVEVADPGVPLGGLEAELSVILTDTNGSVLEERIRVRLVRAELDDLPEPEPSDEPADEPGCEGCHRPLVPGGGGARAGIESMHRPELFEPEEEPPTCVDCHGGDSAADTRSGAHVAPGQGDPSFLRNLQSDPLDDVSLAYLRFVNPGDLRVAAEACGGCHASHVETVPLSVMSTYAGHYTLPRYLAGAQDKNPHFAAVDVTDPDYVAEEAPEGATDAMVALRKPLDSADRRELPTLMDDYLPKACPTCHLNTFGQNNSRGTYRSSGCSACHVVYGDDGLSESADPTVDRFFPSHPREHRLTSAIPTEQCGHCHFQGGRIGLSYRGIREGGFAAEKTPEHAVPLGTPLYGHGSSYYFSDEDDRNVIDETPPDLHHEAGMACIDCHVGGDVHGDGNLYAAERYQVGIRCEDCHGTVRAAAAPGEDGRFRNDKGFEMKRLRRDAEGRVQLELALEDRELEVPQVFELLERGANPRMTEAMGVHDGFSHTDSMECYTCHTSWRLTCFGCHVTTDDRDFDVNQTTGLQQIGAIQARRDDYLLDFFALGKNRRGKLTPLCNSMSMFLSYIDASGELQVDEEVRTSFDGTLGFGWNPFQHHTVSRTAQSCDRCHPVAPGAGPDNGAVLDETWGFGSGRVTAADGDGVVYDLTRHLDETGALIASFPNPGTGPAEAGMRERALAVEVFGRQACDGGPSQFDDTFAAIQMVVFDQYGCSAAFCHGSAPGAGSLDLREGSSYAELVDEPSISSDRLRVEPGDAATSFLWQKIANRTLGTPFEDPARNGVAMPIGGSPVTVEHLEAVALWITAGAPETGVVPGTSDRLGVCVPEPGAFEVQLAALLGLGWLARRRLAFRR